MTILLTLLSFINPIINPTFAAETKVKIPMKVVLIPSKGYDDNDNIQAVVYGSLPNACYKAGDSKADLELGTNEISITQYAWKTDEGDCANEATLPDSMRSAIPFSDEVKLGHLKQGVYQVKWENEARSISSRIFEVEIAPTGRVDNLPYAAVTGLGVADFTFSNEDIVVTMTGFLNSSCVELDTQTQVIRLDDVFVLLPTIKQKVGAICRQIILPFQTTVNLGKVDPGIFLIQSRSMSGKAVNKVVNVQAPVQR